MTSLIHEILIYTIITQRGIFQLLAIVDCETSETFQNVCLLTISNIKVFKETTKIGWEAKLWSEMLCISVIPSALYPIPFCLVPSLMYAHYSFDAFFYKYISQILKIKINQTRKSSRGWKRSCEDTNKRQKKNNKKKQTNKQTKKTKQKTLTK